MTTHFRTCPLCEAMCGLERSSEGRVSRIQPDKDDVWSRGYICPKGVALGDLHHDPDRLRAPLIRDGASWREVGWLEAFTEVERRMRAVVERSGLDAVAAYIGNPTAHNYSLSRYAGARTNVRDHQPVSAGTVDQWPKNVVGALLYGGAWTIPVPDIAHTAHADPGGQSLGIAGVADGLPDAGSSTPSAGAEVGSWSSTHGAPRQQTGPMSGSASAPGSGALLAMLVLVAA